MFARPGRVSSARLLGLHSVRTTAPISHNLSPRSASQFSTGTPREEETRRSEMEKIRNVTARNEENKGEDFWSNLGQESLMEAAQLGLIIGAVSVFTYAGDYWRWVMVIHLGRGLDKFKEHRSNVIEKQRDTAVEEVTWILDEWFETKTSLS